jgi:hypothetical protein
MGGSPSLPSRSQEGADLLSDYRPARAAEKGEAWQSKKSIATFSQCYHSVQN